VFSCRFCLTPSQWDECCRLPSQHNYDKKSPASQIALGKSVSPPYNIDFLRRRLNMLLKQLSVISLLVIFSLQPALPAKACLENCHFERENCHREVLNQQKTPGCPHTKPVSVVAVVTKAGCECTIQDDSSVLRNTPFTLDSVRSERHKSSASDAGLSPGITPYLFRARLHGRPLSSIPDGQDTFLINSRLRI
jgi:hypothetical protein